MFLVCTWAIVPFLSSICAYLITNKSLEDFEAIVFGKLDAVERNANSRYGEKGKEQSLQPKSLLRRLLCPEIRACHNERIILLAYSFNVYQNIFSSCKKTKEEQKDPAHLAFSANRSGCFVMMRTNTWNTTHTSVLCSHVSTARPAHFLSLFFLLRLPSSHSSFFACRA